MSSAPACTGFWITTSSANKLMLSQHLNPPKVVKYARHVVLLATLNPSRFPSLLFAAVFTGATASAEPDWVTDFDEKANAYEKDETRYESIRDKVSARAGWSTLPLCMEEFLLPFTSTQQVRKFQEQARRKRSHMTDTNSRFALLSFFFPTSLLACFVYGPLSMISRRCLPVSIDLSLCVAAGSHETSSFSASSRKHRRGRSCPLCAHH